MDYREPSEQEDILMEPVAPQPAGHGRRLANHLTDYILFSLLVSVVLLARFGNTPAGLEQLKEMMYNPFVGNIVLPFFYSVFMSLQEAIFRGKSIGKMITGTRAVMDDGRPMSTETVFLRNLIRCVPFNPLSALGTPARPWHDRWSRTMVTTDVRQRIL